MPPIESDAKESASTEKAPIEGASREPLSPGNLKKPGLREAAVRAALGSGHTGEEKFSFSLILGKTNLLQRAQCPPNSRRSKRNKLASA